MKEMGVNIEPSTSGEDDVGHRDFGEIIEACRVAFQNYQENKTALQELIDEREEIAREKEDMGFELSRANAELELLRNRFEKSDAGKLAQQLETEREESRELKNDFFIKFQSFSQEIETLKSKLQSYE